MPAIVDELKHKNTTFPKKHTQISTASCHLSELLTAILPIVNIFLINNVVFCAKISNFAGCLTD
jgi:hypothetical protein